MHEKNKYQYDFFARIIFLASRNREDQKALRNIEVVERLKLKKERKRKASLNVGSSFEKNRSS